MLHCSGSSVIEIILRFRKIPLLSLSLFQSCYFFISHDPVRYIGISFTHHHDDFFKLNYVPKLSQIKRFINLWSSRDLSPIEKIVLIKTFLISQLVYLFSVLPNPSIQYFKDLESLVYGFI